MGLVSNNDIKVPNINGPNPSVNALIPFNAPSASPWPSSETSRDNYINNKNNWKLYNANRYV